MAYLLDVDFKKLIQVDNLAQIIGSDNTILQTAKLDAEQFATEYLTQKYDCSQEFQDITLWNRATAFKAKQRIYINADAYNPATAYVVNDLVLQSGNIYICITNCTGAFDASKFTLIGVQNSLFYVTLPHPEFDYNYVYPKGYQVWWENKTYTAVTPTILPSHASNIQQSSIYSPVLNPAPDLSEAMWGTGTAYSVTAGILPTDITKWTAGDNRSRVLVNCCIAIALYNLHKRIAPRNIPELRVKDYDDSIAWLKDAAQGKFITASLPLIQPKQGQRIRFGGNVKMNNQL